MEPRQDNIPSTPSPLAQTGGLGIPSSVSLNAIPTGQTFQPSPSKGPRGGYYWGTGRRKTAVARVRVKPGNGKFQINGRSADQYFTELRDQHDILAPLHETKTEGSLDVFVNVHGGGYHGQAGAVLLGLSRALKNYDPSLEPVLRSNDFLTRDAREVERKKYGQSGARRRFQFSKR